MCAQLTMEKEALENKLEAEQEYIVNRLQKQVGHGAWRMADGAEAAASHRTRVRLFEALPPHLLGSSCLLLHPGLAGVGRGWLRQARHECKLDRGRAWCALPACSWSS